MCEVVILKVVIKRFETHFFQQNWVGKFNMHFFLVHFIDCRNHLNECFPLRVKNEKKTKDFIDHSINFDQSVFSSNNSDNNNMVRNLDTMLNT